MNKPIENLRFYKPIENPRMYPLELTERLEIYLWDEKGKYKWVIAYWRKDGEGYYLKFVGDRPFDKRVDWRNFEAVARFGQTVADARFEEEDDE